MSAEMKQENEFANKLCYYPVFEQIKKVILECNLPDDVKQRLVTPIYECDNETLVKQVKQDTYELSRQRDPFYAQFDIYDYIGLFLNASTGVTQDDRYSEDIYSDKKVLLLAGIFCKLNNIDYKIARMLDNRKGFPMQQIPTGKYTVRIQHAGKLIAKSGKEYWQVNYQIVDGDYSGRVINILFWDEQSFDDHISAVHRYIKSQGLSWDEFDLNFERSDNAKKYNRLMPKLA